MHENDWEPALGVLEGEKSGRSTLTTISWNYKTSKPFFKHVSPEAEDVQQEA